MKKVCKILLVVLIIVGLYFIMRVDVPCEENPKMVMNGYCDTGDNK